MFTEVEIREILAPVISVDKQNINKKKKLEPYSDVYGITVTQARALAVHAVGAFPEDILLKRAPNETQEAFDYRKGIYEPVTRPAWHRALKTTNRIWNRVNFKVEFAEDERQFESEGAKKYFEEEYPQYGSVYDFFESVVTPRSFADPNSVLAVRPRKIPTKLDSNNDLIVDDTQLIEPIGIVFGSEKVVRFVEDVYLLALTSNRVRLSDDIKGQKTGKVFEFYDDATIYRIIQTGKKQDFKYNVEVYYSHKLGYLPCWKLPGEPKQFKETSINESYFTPAVPYLNLAVLDSSTLQMSKYAHAYPQRWELVYKCNAKGCVEGYNHTEDGIVPCGTCNGTNRKERQSPTGTYQITVPTNLDAEGEIFNSLPTPPFGYEAPDDAMLEFARKEINNFIEQAFMFVNIDVSTSNVKGSETALGKIIDREEQFAFLLKISNELFGLLKQFVLASGQMRYNTPDNNGNTQDNFQEPVFTLPKNFRIRTEAELTEEIANAQKNGIDNSAVKRLMKEFFMLRFHLDTNKDKIVNLIFATDRLMGKSDVDINAGIGIGKIAKWEAILHDSIELLIEQQEEGFLELELPQQREKLIADAKALALDIQPLQNSTDQILANITPNS